jgi:hypothetical protein
MRYGGPLLVRGPTLQADFSGRWRTHPAGGSVRHVKADKREGGPATYSHRPAFTQANIGAGPTACTGVSTFRLPLAIKGR